MVQGQEIIDKWLHYWQLLGMLSCWTEELKRGWMKLYCNTTKGGEVGAVDLNKLKKYLLNSWDNNVEKDGKERVEDTSKGDCDGKLYENK